MSRANREYIYGINPAFEVIRARKRKIYEVFLSESSAKNPRLKKLEKFLSREKIPFEWVPKQRVLQLSESKENQGVVLKTEPYIYTPSEDLFGQPRLLLLDNVEDPHNVGGILRCAEVFGFHNVLLPTRGVPDVYPSVVKVSAGASEHLNIAKDLSANKYVNQAKACGYEIVALDAAGKTELVELAEKPFEKMLLVIGGEASAVGQFILNKADYITRIPQSGKVNSLNASVAAGIALYVLGENQKEKKI